MIIQSKAVSNNTSATAESDIDREVTGYISHATERTQRRFIRVAVVAGLVLLLWLWFVSYRSLQDFIAATDQHYRALKVLGAGQQLVFLLHEAEAGADAFLKLGGESYLVPYYKAQREIPEVIERLQPLKALRAIPQHRFDALRSLIMERMGGLASQIADRRSNDPVVIRQLLDPQTERTMRERIRAIATEILDGAERTLTTKHAVALHNRQRSLYAFVFADVLALAVIASLVLWQERISRLHDAEALRESEDRFGQVATMTGEWLWEQDAQGDSSIAMAWSKISSVTRRTRSAASLISISLRVGTAIERSSSFTALTRKDAFRGLLTTIAIRTVTRSLPNRPESHCLMPTAK